MKSIRGGGVLVWCKHYYVLELQYLCHHLALISLHSEAPELF